MKVKDITEKGFYLTGNPEIILEVIENQDEIWVKEEPDAKLLIDEWNWDEDNNVFETSGNLYRLDADYAEVDVEKTDRKFKVYGSMGQFLEEIKESKI